jgi:hypothetical protein
MKTFIKIFLGLTLALAAALFWTTGCMSPDPTPDWHQLFESSDPLVGWHAFSFDPDSVNKAIRDDYQNYIQRFLPKEKNAVGPVQFFEDGTGQHAVEFEVFRHNQNASWQYALIYDKENKRIKVIKYGYRRYQS